MHYQAPLEHMRFVLHDLLGADEVFARLPAHAELGPDLVDAVLEEAARLSEQVLAPLNASGDAEGCHYDPDRATVTTPQGFKQAYAQFVDGGWAGLTAPETAGGQGLPEAVGACFKEMIDSANLAWGTYPLLSQGATDALLVHGSQWQKEHLLKPIVAGRWTGSMCLTEPQAGSDLGLLKTRAEPAGNDSYRIHGTKIFITAGEHDLTENIIHLVLARLPDAPAGSRGISLFAVPKIRVLADGSPGEPNAVHCGAIEHKMGIKGSATCVLNFDGAEGWLIGAPHKGLACMFTMMNTARLAVGIQGLGLMERAFQASLAYCRERRQMRALSGPREPDQAADLLLVHPAIRYMLLVQRAFIEGGRALVLHTALLSDQARCAELAEDRERAAQCVDFLIPICKGFLTEAAQESTSLALQTLGGHGYIVDNGLEQFVRDARITTLYEGTTQIQALDLLGRKVLHQQGAGMRPMLEEILAFCRQQAGHAQAGDFIRPLATATQTWGESARSLAGKIQQQPEELGAAAVDFLFLSGYILIGYFLVRGITAASGHGRDAAFVQARVDAARCYFGRILPRTHAHLAAIESGLASLPECP